jgi:hypothetical protein
LALFGTIWRAVDWVRFAHFLRRGVKMGGGIFHGVWVVEIVTRRLWFGKREAQARGRLGAKSFERLEADFWVEPLVPHGWDYRGNRLKKQGKSGRVR